MFDATNECSNVQTFVPPLYNTYTHTLVMSVYVTMVVESYNSNECVCSVYVVMSVYTDQYLRHISLANSIPSFI